MHGRTRQKRKKGLIWFLTGLTNWVLRGRWKSGNAHRENKQKEHQTVRWSKWGNRGESKMRQTEMLRGKRRSPPCQGRRAVFQARCFCAIWITAGSSCPGLVYKKLRQLLDFPHYCRGIGLIWCPSKFSAVISCRPEGTRSRRSAATCRPPPTAAHHQGWGRGWGGLSFKDKKKHAFVNGQSTCVQTYLCCAVPGVTEVTPTPGLLSDLRTHQEQLCMGPFVISGGGV